MEEVRSMSGALAGLLVEAEQAHRVAVQQNRAVDADWPCWYAGYVSRRLAPIITQAIVGEACLMTEEETAGEDRRAHVRSAVEQQQTWVTDPDTRMRYPVAHVRGRVV